MPNPTGYSRLQIRLHWIITILIVAQFVFHESIAEAWDVFTKTGATEFSPLVASHVFGGMAILLLVLWRLAVRFKRGAPLPPESEHPLLKNGGAHIPLVALRADGPDAGIRCGGVVWWNPASGDQPFLHEVCYVGPCCAACCGGAVPPVCAKDKPDAADENTRSLSS